MERASLLSRVWQSSTHPWAAPSPSPTQTDLVVHTDRKWRADLSLQCVWPEREHTSTYPRNREDQSEKLCERLCPGLVVVDIRISGMTKTDKSSFPGCTTRVCFLCLPHRVSKASRWLSHVIYTITPPLVSSQPSSKGWSWTPDFSAPTSRGWDSGYVLETELGALYILPTELYPNSEIRIFLHVGIPNDEILLSNLSLTQETIKYSLK